jgi:multiple sugar transport system substrate-binding protein
MEEIEFSVIAHSDKYFNDLQRVVEIFEGKNHCRVRLLRLSWSDAWVNILDTALHAKGPDLSQIGTTWLSSLVAMNALRPFSAREIGEVGGETAFFPACWHSVQVFGSSEIWAMPWEANAFILLYRRDVLRQAEIRENSAFHSHSLMEKTLHSLENTGIESPWMPPLGKPAWDLLHSAASWVYGAGGSFLSADGRHAAFTSPEALRGLLEFFSLFRYINPANTLYALENYMDQFVRGRIGVVSCAATYALSMLQAAIKPELRHEVAAALPPGRPAVGGSSLVIWLHTRHTPERERLAVRLAQFLAGQPAQHDFFGSGGSLPVRRDVLETMDLYPNSLLPIMRLALQSGQVYPSIRLWNRVETQLAQALSEIAETILAHPNTDIETLLHQSLGQIAQRLDMTLG